MPKRSRTVTANQFRLNAKKVGLTYSCPSNVTDNPIVGSAELRDFIALKFGPSKYIVSEELHANGTRHYHCYFHFDNKVDSMKADVFDYQGVHPNIINKPGAGWIHYVKKDKHFITNIESGPWATALALPDAKQALEHLWTTAPRDMCLNGDRVQKNVTNRFAPVFARPLYDGPYPERYYPVDWNHRKHSLLIWGKPSMNKSQFAQYLLKHVTGGDIQFFKKNAELLKNVTMPFIFDECECFLNRIPADSREVTDVENGGSIQARNQDADIPPFPRIFTSNYEFPFRNPQEAVYGRRVTVLAI